MDWSILVGLILVICLALFIRLRVEPRRIRLVSWLFIYPGVVLLFLYAWFYAKWLEVGIAVFVSAVIVGAWWFAYGSYLPPASSDNISVWGQEAKKPSVMAAEAQAELEKVKLEKEELEKELARLKQEKEN
jgi:hypothetical protein